MEALAAQSDHWHQIRASRAGVISGVRGVSVICTQRGTVTDSVKVISSFRAGAISGAISGTIEGICDMMGPYLGSWGQFWRVLVGPPEQPPLARLHNQLPQLQFKVSAHGYIQIQAPADEALQRWV
ncbi:MAG: hypothetical protein FRX49_00179 [Trebouxia sp. A1-2]|nr:MAG: hypothetical protein FRX49_00179 [Trebouxia sp. A1-2]